MSLANILVLGGSGFVGRYAVSRLDAAGYAITVPTRRRERARHLILLPQTDVVQMNVHDDGHLERLMSDKDIVVNLVGILHGRLGDSNDPYGPDFRKAHVELAERVVACARPSSVATSQRCWPGKRRRPCRPAPRACCNRWPGCPRRNCCACSSAATPGAGPNG